MSNTSYFIGADRQGDSPVISPLSPGYDQYVSRPPDTAAYFGVALTPQPGPHAAQDYTAAAHPASDGTGYMTPDFMNSQHAGSLYHQMPLVQDGQGFYPQDMTWATTPRGPSVTAPSPTMASRLGANYGAYSTLGVKVEEHEEFNTPNSDAQSGAGRHVRDPRRKQRQRSASKLEDDHLEGYAASQAASNSGGTTRPTPHLRTASRAPKKYAPTTIRRPAASNEEQKARDAHNQVEQQYRKRLNQHFARLLDALPPADNEEDEEGGGGGGGPAASGGGTICSGGGGGGSSGGENSRLDKRVSKAEVLEKARRYIKRLEKERIGLEQQNGELLRHLHSLEHEWARRMHGGSVSGPAAAAGVVHVSNGMSSEGVP